MCHVDNSDFICTTECEPLANIGKHSSLKPWPAIGKKKKEKHLHKKTCFSNSVSVCVHVCVHRKSRTLRCNWYLQNYYFFQNKHRRCSRHVCKNQSKHFQLPLCCTLNETVLFYDLIPSNILPHENKTLTKDLPSFKTRPGYFCCCLKFKRWAPQYWHRQNQTRSEAIFHWLV